MKNLATKQTETNYVISVTCDCCMKEYSDVMDLQEFVHINDIGGYDSAIGDGVHYKCDLCSNCVKKLLGNYLRQDKYDTF